MNQNSHLKFINAADTLKHPHGQGTTSRNVYQIDKVILLLIPTNGIVLFEGAYLLNSSYRTVNSRKDERLREGQLVARAAVVAPGVGKEMLEKGMEKGIEIGMEKAIMEAVAVVGAAAQAAAA